MEENIYDDKLDDYVRKSFEDYEEEPASEMWDRVEAELLPVPAAPGLRATFQQYRWQALAACVILLLFSTLVCEHLYYEEKIRTLSDETGKAKEIPSPNHQTPGGQALQPEAGIPSSPPLAAQAEFVAPKAPASSVSSPNGIRKTEAVKPLEAARNAKASHLPKPENSRDYTDAQNVREAKTRQEQNQIQPEPAFPPGQPNMSLPPETAMLADAEDKTSNPSHKLETSLIPTRIEVVQSEKPFIALDLKRFPSNLALLPIKPHRAPSDWYVGAQTTLTVIKEKSRTPVSRFGRPAIADKQKKSDVSAIYWLKLGKKLNQHLSLETGIGYQQTKQTATHSPRFRFGDGIHQGAPLSALRNFNYDLSTYGGTAEVSLRMEQTAPGVPPSDDEPVALNIVTTAQVKMLRIPLLAAYRVGAGRLQGDFKAGLLGNLILKNELDIAARVSQNAKFKPVSGNDGYTVQLNQGKFFLGYWLSAGAEFKLNQHLSMVAAASLTGDFPRNDKFGHRLPERFLVGLNLGVNYYF